MIGANLQEDGGHPRPGTRLGHLTADDAQERRQDAAALALPRLSPNRRPLGRRCRRWLQKKNVISFIPVVCFCTRNSDDVDYEMSFFDAMSYEVSRSR